MNIFSTKFHRTFAHLSQLQLHTVMASSPNIGRVMRGIQIKDFGGPEVLQYKTKLPIPVPRSGEVLVKNDFIGINYVDIYWRIGMKSQPPNGILGREAEGTIVATGSGDIKNLKVGDRVVWLSMGGYAEYTSVPASTTYVIPSNIKPGIAAAAFLQGLTALVLTQRILQLKRDEWVLIHAAAGGVGLWLCQLAKALGAKTIGTASTDEKIRLAKENGADFMINYKEEKDLVQKVMEITGDQGVSVVYDSVGKDQTENNVEVVAQNGTIVTYGASSGRPILMSPAKMAAKNVRFVGPGEASLMKYISTPHEFDTECTKLFDLIQNDIVNVKIYGTYPLSNMTKVHQDLEGRKTVGKILVKP